MSQQEINKVDVHLMKMGQRDTFPTAVSGSSDIAASSTAFTSSTEDKFIDLAVGQIIKTAGFSEEDNNGDFQIIAKNAANTEITVVPAPTTESAPLSNTITPYWIQMRYTGNGLTRTSQVEMSDTIRSDRMRDDEAEVFVSCGGTLNNELAWLKDDDLLNANGILLECLLESTFSPRVSYTGAGAADDFKFATSKTLTVPEAVASAFVAGQWIRISGASNPANNGDFKIASKTSTTITVTKPQDATWTDFTAEDSAEATIAGSMIRNGSTRHLLALEEKFPDLSTVGYRYWSNLRVTQYNLNATARQKIQQTFTFMGKDGEDTTTQKATDYLSASPNPIVTASANVGTILENDTVLSTAVQSLQVNLNNNGRERDKIGSKYAIDNPFGFLEVEIPFRAYFEDQTLLTKVRNRTTSNLAFFLTDANGNTMIFTVPKCYVKGDLERPGVNNDIFANLTMTAVRDASTDCMIQIDMLPA